MIRVFIFLIIIMPWKVFCQQMTVNRSDGGIEVLENNKKVLFFQASLKSINGKYERAGYIHPLYGFNEKVITEDMPVDHPHHHGIFWAWHQIMLNGKMVADGWTSENISWNMVKSKAKRKAGSVIIYSSLDWKLHDTVEKRRTIVSEKTKVTIHAAENGRRSIDFDIFLKPGMANLSIGGSEDEKGYGGFSVRLRLPDDIIFISGTDTVLPQTNAVKAGPWMNFEGSFEGDEEERSAVAIFSGNPERPHSWVLRKKASMQNIAFPGREPFTLPAGGLRLRYRIVVQQKPLRVDELQQMYVKYLQQLS